MPGEVPTRARVFLVMHVHERASEGNNKQLVYSGWRPDEADAKHAGVVLLGWAASWGGVCCLGGPPPQGVGLLAVRRAMTARLHSCPARISHETRVKSPLAMNSEDVAPIHSDAVCLSLQDVCYLLCAAWRSAA
jgi:hypothetical protein